MPDKNKRPVILVTNDDGVEAKGIKSLIEVVRPLGRVIVVAPADPHSGMSHAITVKVPLRLEKVLEEQDLLIYKCHGTPVDCVKMAFNHLLTDKPDLLVSGINHGSNASTSVFYSGTMGAVLEGCINEIPSVGFSLLNLDYDADFTAAKHFAGLITKKVLQKGLPVRWRTLPGLKYAGRIRGIGKRNSTNGWIPWEEIISGSPVIFTTPSPMLPIPTNGRSNISLFQLFRRKPTSLAMIH
jgi:5'-nucleotidase